MADKSAWRKALETPSMARVAQTILGAALLKPAPSDARRAVLVSKVLERMPKAYASDQTFVESLVGACDQPKGGVAWRVVRDAVAGLLRSLTKRGGLYSAAHRGLVKVLVGWLSHASLKATPEEVCGHLDALVALFGGADAPEGGPAGGEGASAGAGAASENAQDGGRSPKRARVEGGAGLRGAWEQPEFRETRGWYAKLVRELPSDRTAALRWMVE